ncbi:tRNA-dihydrouridine synthase 2 [Exophiala xenobiotica]|uniref:tRNA-dihydrouridine synthase 2 n=1 Tax=Vermiconidia calcicola TaxID=1690605 RepID=A0AAV9QM88_9PEZI|nr:tRNA-dihydrouridine synthase 2 [Exophiala xenobiotica]KAK5439694.1 tRNA-dihydrouridine synthase 2 [Exophiala xenobiotica]KAK5545225.1 tRNA-dihydrouridine synthase 2 [Vermiconidia calcicola]
MASPSAADNPPLNIPHVPIPKNGADYRGKVVLAPMVRSGELPSRLLALKYGADLVWGPETVDRSMIGTTRHTNPRTGCIEWSRNSNNQNPNAPTKESTIFRIDPKRESDRLIYQIGTASPEFAVDAATLVAPYVCGIDVNAGCPKPFSTSGGMGAALLRTPDKLCDILTTLVTKVGIPHEIGISVKIRLLETPELTSVLVNRLCKTGITGLTIHCRTTPMRPRERAIREQLRMIGEICRSHGVACLMNGDVTSREEGMALAREYGVDGAMIATAAEANSSVFRPKDQGGPAPWQEVVEEYLKLAISVENRYTNTKFLLSQLMPGKNPNYQRIQMSKSYSEALSILEIIDSETVEQAKEVDHVLGLDVQRTTKADMKRHNKQQNKMGQAKKQEKKRALEEKHDHNEPDRPSGPERTKKQKAEIAAENAGFDGVGQGAMAIAV